MVATTRSEKNIPTLRVLHGLTRRGARRDSAGVGHNGAMRTATRESELLTAVMTFAEVVSRVAPHVTDEDLRRQLVRETMDSEALIRYIIGQGMIGGEPDGR